MNGKNLDAFVRLVLSEDALQSELREVVNRQDLVSRVMELGVQNGFEFSVADVEEAMRSNRQQWLKT